MSSNSFAFVGSVFTISSGRSFLASSESPVTLNDMVVSGLCESSLKCILRMRRFEEIHLLTNERTGNTNHLALPHWNGTEWMGLRLGRSNITRREYQGRGGWAPVVSIITRIWADKMCSLIPNFESLRLKTTVLLLAVNEENESLKLSLRCIAWNWWKWLMHYHLIILTNSFTAVTFLSKLKKKKQRAGGCHLRFRFCKWSYDHIQQSSWKKSK